MESDANAARSVLLPHFSTWGVLALGLPPIPRLLLSFHARGSFTGMHLHSCATSTQSLAVGAIVGDLLRNILGDIDPTGD